MKKNISSQSAGFTLVELLVVTAIMGLVVAGMYSVSLTMSKSTYQQEEVVEVQQNLRVAMGQIARDIRMAGFLIPLVDSPLQTAEEEILTIRNATVSGRLAQISADFNSNASEKTIDVSTSEMVDLFDTTNHKYVRIIRPADREEPFPSVLTVTGKSRSGPTLTLSGFDSSAPKTFREGDVIVGVPSTGAAHPETITYQLQPDGDLERNGEVVASYLTEIVFEYLRADGSQIATPVVVSELDDIGTVRVTMTGGTDPLKTGMTDGIKTRQLTQVVRIRNQR